MSQNIFLTAFSIAFLAAMPLHAAAIVNISRTPHWVQVREAGGYVPRQIEGYGKLEWPGDIDVRFGGREVRIERGEEYAIWPDGTFGPQWRRQYKHQKF
jgi:hypothetical protein